jgi:hypothetical protein
MNLLLRNHSHLKWNGGSTQGSIILWQSIPIDRYDWTLTIHHWYCWYKQENQIHSIKIKAVHYDHKNYVNFGWHIVPVHELEIIISSIWCCTATRINNNLKGEK